MKNESILVKQRSKRSVTHIVYYTLSEKCGNFRYSSDSVWLPHSRALISSSQMTFSAAVSGWLLCGRSRQLLSRLGYRCAVFVTMELTNRPIRATGLSVRGCPYHQMYGVCWHKSLRSWACVALTEPVADTPWRHICWLMVIFAIYADIFMIMTTTMWVVRFTYATV